MHSLFLALAATPDPTPAGTLKPGLTEDQVSPGLWGFLATAFVVLLSIFLIVDMVRRLRRVRYRTQVEEEREAQAAEARDAGGEAAGDGAVPADGGKSGADGPGNDGTSEDRHEGRAAHGAGNGSVS